MKDCISFDNEVLPVKNFIALSDELYSGWSLINYSNTANKLSWGFEYEHDRICLLYTSPSPRDGLLSRMPSSA